MTPSRASYLASQKLRQPQAVAIVLSKDGEMNSICCKADKVEIETFAYIRKGYKIERVGGMIPPKGSDGVAYYDSEFCGPYWVSEL